MVSTLSKKISLSPLSALDVPQPFRVKVRALLKPHHPFFVFGLAQLEGDLAFSLSVRNVLCRDTWLQDRYPTLGLSGIFPLESFGEGQAAYARFEAFVFRSLLQLVSDLTHARALESLPLVTATGVDWPTVALGLKQLTDPLKPWFDFELHFDDAHLVLLAAQPVLETPEGLVPGWLFEDIGQQVRPWHAVAPTVLIQLDRPAIEGECREFVEQRGVEFACAMVRKLILEQLTNGLYYLRFAL